MEILKLSKKVKTKKSVAAIGFFDGIHIAHQELIKKTIQIGDKKKLNKIVITFDNHPKSIINNNEYKEIITFKEKIEILKKYDIDYIYIIKFSKETSKITPQKFIEKYLKNIDTIICGFDFKFGHKAQGNTKSLQEIEGLNTVIIDEIKHENIKISSTQIKELVKNKDYKKASYLLGYEYKKIKK